RSATSQAARLAATNREADRRPEPHGPTNGANSPGGPIRPTGRPGWPAGPGRHAASERSVAAEQPKPGRASPGAGCPGTGPRRPNGRASRTANDRRPSARPGAASRQGHAASPKPDGRSAIATRPGTNAGSADLDGGRGEILAAGGPPNGSRAAS